MICKYCTKDKEASEFYSRFMCKTCRKERKENTRTLYLYGLTKEAVAELQRKQNNCCAICKEKFIDKHKIYIDHCHITRKVRGLLCPSCNTLIANLEGSMKKPGVFIMAMAYLQTHVS